jgi:hypothetical protein
MLGGEKMKMNYNRIRELAIVTAVSSLLLLMVPSGSMAAQGDWSIEHNWEYVPNGGECHILATDGVNHVEGTFEWGYGLTFQYSYDSTNRYNVVPAPSWYSGYYYFDFDTGWHIPYGDYFTIYPSTGPTYSCQLPL